MNVLKNDIDIDFGFNGNFKRPRIAKKERGRRVGEAVHATACSE